MSNSHIQEIKNTKQLINNLQQVCDVLYTKLVDNIGFEKGSIKEDRLFDLIFNSTDEDIETYINRYLND
jgi:hypothetical protein